MSTISRYNTAFTWRVDETNEFGTTTGTNWTFTTITFAPPAASTTTYGGETVTSGDNLVSMTRYLAAAAKNAIWSLRT